jgi:arylformamidase
MLATLGTSIESEIGRYRALSDEVVATRQVVELRYGPLPRNMLLTAVEDKPTTEILVYVHGGYWQDLSVRDSLFLSNIAKQSGMGFVAVGYSLAPQATVREIINEIICALTFVRAGNLDRRLTVVGSSAGAHLVACALHRRSDLVDRAVLLSGIYDLRPLVTTYINGPLGLDADEAAALSPLLENAPDVSDKAVIIAIGEHETEAFHEQTRRYAEHLGVGYQMVAGRHHFDLPLYLDEVDGWR